MFCGIRLQHDAELGRLMRQPLADPVGRQRIEPDGVGSAGQLPVLGFLARALHHDHYRLGAGTLEIPEELGCVPWSFASSPRCPRSTTTRRSAIMGKVLQRAWISSASSWAADRWSKLKSRSVGIEGPVQDGLDRLILEDVFRPVEVVDRRQLALLEGAEQGVHRMCGHEGIVDVSASYWLLAYSCEPELRARPVANA